MEAESARLDHDFAIHKVLALLALHTYVCTCALIPYHWGVGTPKTKGGWSMILPFAKCFHVLFTLGGGAGGQRDVIILNVARACKPLAW